MSIRDMPVVDIYTDGSCDTMQRIGGWAANLITKGAEKIIYGFETDTTSQRMELTAVLNSILALKKPCNVRIFTDSQYVIGVLSKEWKASANKDLVIALRRSAASHNVSLNYVPGHSGHSKNELVDRYAKKARKEQINSK